MSTKRKLLLLLFVLCIFVIPLVMRIMEGPDPVKAEDEVITEEEYTTMISKYHRVSPDDILKPEFTGLVFFGRASCEKCRLFLPVVQSIVRGKENKVYYFDTDANREHVLFDEALDRFAVTSVPDILWIASEQAEGFSTDEIKEGGKFYEWVEEKLNAD